MRVAVTGAAGRLGSALVARLSGAAHGRAADGRAAAGAAEVVGWTRAEFDLDDPEPVAESLAAVRPDLVIHAAAWTDVDGCAREPELALRRNGEATAVLARACARLRVSLITVSTNEVFDGERAHDRGYRPDDVVNPPNAYGRSKLAGERGAIEAFDGFGADAGSAGGSTSPALGIVRTAWLFGAGKPDFPARIVAAARSAASEGRPLRLVNDEFGTPTYVRDLADAIARLASADFHGIHHVVNAGVASRADWARDVLGRVGVEVPVEEISVRDFSRPSTPPRWGVLEATPLPGGPLRGWREAMADRLAAAEIA